MPGNKSATVLIRFPEGFEETERLIEAKGWLDGVCIELDDLNYELCFYDPIRFSQTAHDELRNRSYYFERNLVILEKVNRESVISTIEQLVASGDIKKFAPGTARPDQTSNVS